MASEREKVDDVLSAAQVGARNGGIDLTEWEEEFIESLDDRLNDERSLTDKQREILDRLWDKI